MQPVSSTSDKQATKRTKKKRYGGKAIKFRCDYSSTPLKVLESRGWTRIYDAKDRRWDLWWCDTSEIKLALDCNFQRLRAQQRVAHFLNHGELTRKNLLYRNLKRYKRLLLKAGKSREAELCDIMPVSFELPSEYRMLVEEYRKNQGATWIVKPAAGSQGRGIFLFQRLKDLAEWRSKEYPPPSCDSYMDPECPAAPDIYIVQKYIDDPYLLGGCKFDMRIYVLVTSFQPLKVWLAREGFARLSGEQFSLERIDDSRVHLTNMSIQLKANSNKRPAPTLSESQAHTDYEQTSPPAKLGSKWPLSSLRQYLTDRHGAAVVDELLHNIAASEMENNVEHSNKENEKNGTNGTDEKCNEGGKSNGTEMKRPMKVQSIEKTLRIGWLDRAPGKTKYRKVPKPRGGVKKIKLDASVAYLAYQIRRMAIEAFEAPSSDGQSCAIEDEYVVRLGNFGGQVICDFTKKDGSICDIWDYCKERGKTLYQLNLFMLTSPIDEEDDEETGKADYNPQRTISTRRVKARPKIVNDVRVLYEYVRRSVYTNELSYVECDRSELHRRVFDDQYGACASIESFDPSDHDFSIARIEKSGQVLMQICIDDDTGTKSIEFPASAKSEAPFEEHAVLYDLDQLQGYCNDKFGIGFVPSCGHACRPLFAWYKDGELFKKQEGLYWLTDVEDGQSHLWSCTVTCAATGRCLKSKEISLASL